MKKQLILLFLFMASYHLRSQDFQKSNTFFLSEIDKNLTMKELQNVAYVAVYLKDDKKNNIKKIKVFWESYENDGVVTELNNPNLINITKIVQVNISNCACYCNNESYYWLITKQNKWIEIPLIEEEDFDLTQTTRSYHFFKNEISLVEEKFKIIDYDKGKIESIYKKVVKKYFWDGTLLIEI